MANKLTTLKKYLRYLGSLFVFSIVIALILQVAFFNNLNNIFIDPLLGQISARKEVVIVGIDDKSLQSIGAWPWDRSVFATALTNIDAQKPASIGFDVLFLENRSGDDKLTQVIENNPVPVVMGSKIVDGTVLHSVFDGKKNVYSGFVNFTPDSDGKIRNTQTFQQVSNECEISFGLAMSAQYFQENPASLCSNSFALRANSYTLNSNNSLQFSYTKDNFTAISIVDVVQGKFSADFFKDKIVLIGSTALDLRSELNDNFTDIFGDTIPGVQIHANILNSFLQNSFLNQLNPLSEVILFALFTLIFALLFLRSKKAILDLTIMIVLELSNLVIGLLLLNFGIIIPLIQIAIFIFAIYIFSLSYRYLTKTRENQYVKTIFSRYLNKDLMNILLQNSDRLKLGGETRKMTVMFSDIRSFTTISEGLTSVQLVEMLNDYLSYMTAIILSNRGTVDKYIGDAIMAFWNAPLDDANQTANAIKTALEMKDQLAAFGKMHPEYPEIKIGIGVNTGEMTVGNVGGKDRFDYTVLGDNVNLGSRLEGLTKKYGVTVIISESVKDEYAEEIKRNEAVATAEAKKDAKNVVASDEIVTIGNYIFRLMDDMKVKGKNDPVKIFEPIRKEDFEKVRKQVEVYEEAFKVYQHGEFNKAIELLNKNGDDKASVLFIERINTLIQNPPEEWHGIWKWEEK